jgi:hypothetical protein
MYASLVTQCACSERLRIDGFEDSGWESLAGSKLTKMCFICVPGHAGVKGNERADRLARKANMVDQCDRSSGKVVDQWTGQTFCMLSRRLVGKTIHQGHRVREYDQIV